MHVLYNYKCSPPAQFSYMYLYELATHTVSCRDGQTRPGPRAETGLIIFYLRFLCALCSGRWVVTRELCIVVTCKCVAY